MLSSTKPRIRPPLARGRTNNLSATAPARVQQSHEPLDPQAIRLLLHTLDSDGDDKLVLDDIVSFLKRHDLFIPGENLGFDEDTLRSMFNEADYNGNGLIGYDELSKAVSGRFKRAYNQNWRDLVRLLTGGVEAFQDRPFAPPVQLSGDKLGKEGNAATVHGWFGDSEDNDDVVRVDMARVIEGAINGILLGDEGIKQRNNSSVVGLSAKEVFPDYFREGEREEERIGGQPMVSFSARRMYERLDEMTKPMSSPQTKTSSQKEGRECEVSLATKYYRRQKRRGMERYKKRIEKKEEKKKEEEDMRAPFITAVSTMSSHDARLLAAQQRHEAAPYQDPSIAQFRQTERPVGQRDFVVAPPRRNQTLSSSEGSVDHRPLETLLREGGERNGESAGLYGRWISAIHIPDKHHSMGTGERIDFLQKDPYIEAPRTAYYDKKMIDLATGHVRPPMTLTFHRIRAGDRMEMGDV